MALISYHICQISYQMYVLFDIHIIHVCIIIMIHTKKNSFTCKFLFILLVV